MVYLCPMTSLCNEVVPMAYILQTEVRRYCKGYVIGSWLGPYGIGRQLLAGVGLVVSCVTKLNTTG